VSRPRSEKPEGGIYHLFARGNDRCVIFRDVADRELYLRLLAQVREKAGWKVLSYCLMDNHLHLVVETREGNLGWGMQWLHARYVQAFNRRHGRSGHLFGERFGSTVIEDDGHLCWTLRYVALNPVGAGMCRRPQDWAWSSCAATLVDDRTSCVDVDRVLESFEWLGGDPMRRFAEMVEAAPAAEPAGAGAAGAGGESAAPRATPPKPKPSPKRARGKRRRRPKRHPP
jgi:REP element-mobilizing transposase RayT